ncbi:YjcB family protein [Phytobacter sp. V91]|uniref:YjcB family protein n=1 Tax=Phytobacter sp. V91 TaxID=3369425 RepID=UPI003F62ECFA
MATLTTSVVLLRWQILSAVLMFMASTLNIRFRKADYIGLAVISSGLGMVAACWFATGLLGITLLDASSIWHNVLNIMEEMSQKAPPEWPMVIT